jgi:rod shape-determining protein MreC
VAPKRKSPLTAPVDSSSVPRNRTARTAVLGVSVRRAAAGQLPTRSSTALRRRAIVGGLVILALVLITISFRDPSSGPAGTIQNVGSAVLHPFEVAGTRVARPFRDAYDWFDSLFTARSDAKKLRTENQELRQRLIQNDVAANELQQLKQLLRFKEGPSFPKDYTGLAASVIGRPSSAFAQSCDGVEKEAPVVTAQGLVGVVTRTTCHASRVTLLTDESSSVSALDVKTDAAGIVTHASGAGTTLVLSYVAKEDKVEVGDTVVTAGWKTKNLSSLYPKDIAIGKVTSVSQSDTDLYKQVQVQPFADFTSIDAVLVLVRKASS